MHFSSSLMLSLIMGLGSVLAQKDQVMIHVVKVGSNNGSLTYSPKKITAAAGEMVQFQFAGGNHTVTQSTFDQPCMPISMATPEVTGFFSGYMPVTGGSNNMPTYTIMVNSTMPIWIYCSQGKHCQNGMSMVINENTKANPARSLENYAAASAKAVGKQPETGPTKSTPNAMTPGMNGGASSPSGAVPRPSGGAGGNIGGGGGGSAGGNGTKVGGGAGGNGPSAPSPSSPIASSASRLTNFTFSMLICAIGGLVFIM
ncbi:BgTH12-05505 [Blumeria graminis f. sp. triticale]|uniref:Bgt-178 n=3 Tax=Blumeria graminis TaxID=34373 RepID=A0A061HBI3_BLUGR|nr:hypothetical protein BGT96224_178 [Blumeria graminis f. sp. tritici 96224]CAD6503760.1 BgTH12-05505 [Blumeria graminis f. sp. triticale]VDB90357.1 Bgt-178 [Blumeria graminis f. sp. tritici]